MTPEIRKMIYNWKYDKTLHGSEERSIPLQLQKLFGFLQFSKGKPASTETITKSFGWTKKDRLEIKKIKIKKNKKIKIKKKKK
jgi:hypothetical protein